MNLELTPIEQTPDRPCMVLYFSGTRTWGCENGQIISHPIDSKKPYRDERFDLGYWDGEVWRWSGTGHDVWEYDLARSNPDLPTHYMIIEAPFDV